jgi:hypothetical protein
MPKAFRLSLRASIKAPLADGFKVLEFAASGVVSFQSWEHALPAKQ